MSKFITLVGTIGPVAVVLLITASALGCDGSPTQLPLSPTPPPTAAPTPPPDAAPFGSMFGVVYETTQTGPIPVEGVRLGLLTCLRENCPAATTAFREVTTDKDGAFRIPDVYDGPLNFLWILKEGYKAADPIPAGCDGCDRIVAISGDTRLDVEVVRP
jgi:hypothetical protein